MLLSSCGGCNSVKPVDEKGINFIRVPDDSITIIMPRHLYEFMVRQRVGPEDLLRQLELQYPIQETTR